MYRIQHCGANFAAAPWRQQIARWSRLLDAYSYENDVPFWYGEQPLNASFAAAASLRRGGWGLVEPGMKAKDGRRRRYVDAWFGLTDDDDQAYTMEAKFLYSQARATKPVHDRLMVRIRDARSQLSNIARHHRYGKRLAVVWLVPRFPLSSSTDPTQSIKLFQGYASEVGTWAANPKESAWSYVASVGVSEPATHAKRAYPGLVIFAREWVRTR